MACLNLTLNEDEILELLATGDVNILFRHILQKACNRVLQLESEKQLGAESYERSSLRQDYRNGSRGRELKTRVGTLSLTVPRHRNQPFKTMVFDNYARSEAALISTMAQMVVSGVSTRKVSKVLETLCGSSISKSAVSDLCKTLMKDVEAFRNRPLTRAYPFVTVDATYFKAREKQRVISKALLIATGTNEEGKREVLGFGVYPRESKDTWTEFFQSLKKRGLHGVLIITSDAHEGILHGISRVFPDTSWQRCQFHFARNIAEKAPKKYQAGLRGELTGLFRCKSLSEARRRKAEIMEDYGDVAEKAMQILDEGFESAMTVMYLPESLRIFYRTSNHIERLNRELKRRSTVIGIFPDEESILRLVGNVLIEQHEGYQMKRAIFSPAVYQRLTSPELQRQLRVIAQEQQTWLAA